MKWKQKQRGRHLRTWKWNGLRAQGKTSQFVFSLNDVLSEQTMTQLQTENNQTQLAIDDPQQINIILPNTTQLTQPIFLQPIDQTHDTHLKNANVFHKNITNKEQKRQDLLERKRNTAHLRLQQETDEEKQIRLSYNYLEYFY